MRLAAIIAFVSAVGLAGQVTGIVPTTDQSVQPRPTGTLRGRVDIMRTGTPSVRRPSITDLAGALSPPSGDDRPAVVYLEVPAGPDGAALRAALPEPGRARMDQRNETFTPHVLAISAGSSVDFPNNDRTFHNVFSISRTRSFDLGRYGNGKSKTVRFDRPGVVRVFCDIHSHMSAYVLVFNHPYHATTDADGRYRIENIPPGTYAVSAWHEGTRRDMRTVTIPAGASVGLDLLVR